MKSAKLVFAAAVGVCGGVLVAGPLDPPSGAIVGTGKTLSEVEPRTAISAVNTPGDATSQFIISKSGSYYLTGNVQGVSGKDGIVIAASNVSLDLNGFALTGLADSGAAVLSLNPATNVRVCNGTVDGWAGGGVFLSVATGVVESIVSSNNKIDGIRVGEGSVVRGCIASGNGSNGIVTAGQCVISNCTSRGNASIGISASARTQVIGCTSTTNKGGGIGGSFGTSVVDCTSSLNQGAGVFLQNGGRVSRCSVTQNGFHGIVAESDSLITDNDVRGNGSIGTGAGVVVSGDDNRIEGNKCTDNQVGVQALAAGNIIARNTCAGNAQNWSIVANNKCLVVVAANAGAIGGDSGGTGFGSTDPNANFTY